VDNLTLADAVEHIARLARIRDGKARLVSTLNVDFLVNALGTGVSRARHPELLDVLRKSDMVTADGFPILWLSRIVGKPLRQRVCGSDLVPELASRARGDKLSLFLLGGAEGVARKAGQILQAENPGLRIAGSAAPYVKTAGPGLAEGLADDEALVEKINSSGADILLLGLGNPKQELWFNRNRERLTVPVSIGVGGSFEFITGGTKRAPVWVQRCNLEWVFRISQDPARLWRRYVKGLFKLALLTAPLLASRAGEMIAFAGRRAIAFREEAWRTVWSSRDQALAVVRLPRLVSADYIEALASEVARQAERAALCVVDFSRVRRIAMAGHHALFTLSELQQQRGNILLLGVSPRLHRQLAACRVLDVLGKSEGSTLSNLEAGVGARGHALSCRSYVMQDAALIFLAGKVDAGGLAQLAFIECLRHSARDRACIVDLRNVTLLESSAIAMLEPILAASGKGLGRVMFSGASDSARQMFRMARPGAAVDFINDARLLALITEGEPANCAENRVSPTRVEHTAPLAAHASAER
jgi:N-acetylglucosaminyldiphosphoundecaprenol N-acetyl-beta-D-mannosaminyltransferase